MTPPSWEDDTLGFPAAVTPNTPLTKTERRALITIVALIVACFVIAMSAPDAKAATQRCFVPSTATVKGEPIRGHRGQYGTTRQVNTTIALRLADRMRTPYRHRVGVIAAATQEDSQQNQPRGHGTSVGYLQLINIHGSVSWRMRVENSAGWFLRGAKRLDPRGTARLATTRRGHGLIQRIQRSGHPYAYNQWIAEAASTYKKYRATCR